MPSISASTSPNGAASHSSGRRAVPRHGRSSIATPSIRTAGAGVHGELPRRRSGRDAGPVASAGVEVIEALDESELRALRLGGRSGRHPLRSSGEPPPGGWSGQTPLGRDRAGGVEASASPASPSVDGSSFVSRQCSAMFTRARVGEAPALRWGRLWQVLARLGYSVSDEESPERLGDRPRRRPSLQPLPRSPSRVWRASMSAAYCHQHADPSGVLWVERNVRMISSLPSRAEELLTLRRSGAQ